MIEDSKNSIRFASINIEHGKHHATVLPFLKNFKPDVLCLQELLECDIPKFEQELGMKCIFAPMMLGPSVLGDPSSPTTSFGCAIFSTLPVIDSQISYYVGSLDTIPTFHMDPQTGAIVTNKVVIVATVSFGGVPYTFATTHFTWTNHGAVNDNQRSDLKKLFGILDAVPEFVLVGDFNAPRGREIFTTIASRYKDNIPPEYTTSIDKNLHRAGDLGFMVDGLFTTPRYVATEVKLTDGVSDHMAITALAHKM